MPAHQIRLIWRLFWDRRVSLFLKLLPLIGVGYAIFPEGAIPFIGACLATPLEDVAVLTVTMQLFVNWAPAEVVAEHSRAIALDAHRRAGYYNHRPEDEENVIDQ